MVKGGTRKPSSRTGNELRYEEWWERPYARRHHTQKQQCGLSRKVSKGKRTVNFPRWPKLAIHRRENWDDSVVRLECWAKGLNSQYQQALLREQIS